MKKIIFLICIAIQLANAQQSKEIIKNQIATSFSKYFENNSENVFLHLNKNKFLSNESIWFNAYVINKKDGKLNPNTTNLVVKMYNDQNELVYNSLNYVSNGITNGQIKLKEKLPTGTYFIHAYTNYMNNFIEDESSLYKIDIFDLKDQKIKKKSNAPFDLSYNIEGGNLLYQSENKIAVRAIDVNGDGFKTDNIELKDEKGVVISTIKTNEQGYGFSFLTNPNNEKYSLSLKQDKNTITKNLNSVKTIGFNISVNNNVNKENLILKIETNDISLAKYKNENLTLLINQNEKIKFIDIIIKDKTTQLIIAKNQLYEGINILRLIDNDLNLHSERIVYNETNCPKITISKKQQLKDSIIIQGKIKNKIGVFSISTNPVPENSNFNTTSSILDKIKINSYLNEEIKDLNHYLSSDDRTKKIEFDIALIHSKPKYNWINIKKGLPKLHYEFDLGVNLKGKIYNYDVEDGKLRFISKDGINYTIPVSSNGDFEFKNLVLTDSTSIFLTLLDKKERVVKTAIHSRLINNNPSFNKVLKIDPIVYDNSSSIEILNTNDQLFETNDLVLLNEIILSSKQKEKEEFRANPYSYSKDPYKITETHANTYRDVLTFLEMHGCKIERGFGEFKIRSRINGFVSTSLKNIDTLSTSGKKEALLFIDDVIIPDGSIFDGMMLDQVDEIYIDLNTPNGYGTRGLGGIIKVYSRKGYINKKQATQKTKEIIVENGFKKQHTFKNLTYTNYNHPTFKKIGAIHWSPKIYTDKNGDFEIKIPTLNQNQIKLNIQGIDNEGNVYNEEQIITIE